MNRSLVSLLLFLVSMLGAEAGWNNKIKEIRLRKAVVPALYEKCGSEAGMNVPISLLRRDMKKTSSGVFDYVKHNPMSRPMYEVEPDPKQVNAIADHICETKTVAPDLYKEMLWYENSVPQGGSYKMELETGITSQGFDSDSSSEMETAADNENQVVLISLSKVEVFVIGFVLGALCILFVNSVKHTEFGSTRETKTLRRPEL